MILTSADVNQMSMPYKAIVKSEEVKQGYPIKKVSTLLDFEWRQRASSVHCTAKRLGKYHHLAQEATWHYYCETITQIHALAILESINNRSRSENSDI